MSIYSELGITRRGRYKGLKAKLWDVFAYYVCLRDYKKYGTCITCGQKKELKGLQAGHYYAAGNCGFALLFDEDNVSAECQYDNGFNPNHQVEYRQNLIGRIGQSGVDRLDKLYKDSHYGGHTTKEYSKKEYEKKIEEYVEKIKDLQLR